MRTKASMAMERLFCYETRVLERKSWRSLRRTVVLSASLLDLMSAKEKYASRANSLFEPGGARTVDEFYDQVWSRCRL